VRAIVRAKLRWTLLLGLVLLTGFAGVWIGRARHALDEAQAEIRDAGIAFKIGPLSDAKPTTVDSLPSPPDFRDAQLFHDRLYICGAGGIWVYNLAGELQASYLVGHDLPPSPPVAMTAGTLVGDAESRLWIGTANAGLLVSDGIRFSHIQFETKGYGSVTSLFMLPTGTLLIGFSEGGVVAYDGTRMKPFHPNLGKIPVTALAGGEGDLWIGTRDRGVIHWRGSTTEEFQDENALPDNRVLSITVSDDRVFVGTPVGTAEFRDGKFFRTLAEGVFSQALLATADNLLIGTVDEGIVDIRLANQRPVRSVVSHPQMKSAKRLFNMQGKAFALTADALFEREARTGEWMHRIAITGSTWTDRNVSALSLDSTGKLWIGYFDRGIDIADNGDGQKIMHVEDDQVFCINRIVTDNQHNMQVVATANGIALFSREGRILQRLGRSDGLISEHVTDVAVRPDGLAAATAAGITLLASGGPESIYAFHGLANNHVYALGSSGTRLLAGTLGGLSIIQDGFVRASYTTSNSPLKQNWVSAIVPLGNTWFVGTYGGGVLQFEADGRWSEFPDFPPQTVINPNAMLAVSNLVLAGTLDRGLLVYNATQHRWVPMTDGLPSLNVTALAASGGTLFIGTDNGIVRMPVERLLQ
jgi:ligand-binding sensor domain-containing protein